MKRFNVSDGKLIPILMQVAYLREVALLPSQTVPCSLDGSLNPEYIIPLKNGLLDWSVYPYVLHPPTSSYYTFNYLPYSWEGEKDSDL